MKKLSFVFATLFVVAFFVACSNSAGNSSGGDSGTPVNNGPKILDLRIKKNGVVNVSKKVTTGYEDGAIFTGPEKLTSEHAKIEKVEGGLNFTITRPTADCYKYSKDWSTGWRYVAIYREEKINGVEWQTTCAVVDFGDGKSDTLNCFYPLCEPGERYIFKVQLEPVNVENNRDYHYYEWLSVTAGSGIGDIDYSNIDAGGFVVVTYDGTKPIVELKNCIPLENANNPKTTLGFFVTNKATLKGENPDWDTNNATIYFGGYTSTKGVELIVENGFNDFKKRIAASSYDSVFAQYSFTFDVSGATGISEWRTTAIQSNIVTVSKN